MIGSVKEKFGAQGRAVTVVYNGFSCEDGNEKDVLYATDSRNCDCSDGDLKCGLGEDLFTNCSGGWYYPVEKFTPARIFIKPYLESGSATKTFRACINTSINESFEYDRDAAEYVRKLSFGVEIKPVLADTKRGATYVFMYCSLGVWWYYDSMGGKIFSETVYAGCNFAGRNFFAVKPYRIYFSVVLNPEEYGESANESGWIDLPENGGQVVAFASIRNELYALREFEILKLDVRKKASEFALKTLAYNGGCIYGDSVAACGDKIFFFAADGLWAFDGETFKKLRLGDRIRAAKAPKFRAACACRKYILQYIDENGEERSIVVSQDGEHAYFGFYRNALTDTYGYALNYDGNAIMYATEGGKLPYGEKYFFNTQCDLGKTGRKTLRSLTISGRGAVDVSVSNGEREDKFSLDFSQGAQTVRLDMKGDKFSLTFELGEQSSVQQVKAMGYAL